MTDLLSRRDFLKFTGAMYLASNFPSMFLAPQPKASEAMPNILIIVFDAFSACNISLFGYERPTTPNLSRLAERATIFHNHYAGGNYTIPGTSSILTGTYPFTHRALNANVGIAPFFKKNNLFTAFDQYFSLSYTHNPYADRLLTYFQIGMDKHKDRQDLYIGGDLPSDLIFPNDEDMASFSWSKDMVNFRKKPGYSLFLSHIYEAYRNGYLFNKYSKLYPRGIPNILDAFHFILEDAIDWTLARIPSLPQPFLGYFHFLPPHGPYDTRLEFIDRFKDDGYNGKKKPEHNFSFGRSYEEMEHNRRMYDEFILLADEEFGRMFDQLDQSGLLNNTIVVLTSDHGELFERGIVGHYSESLFEPILKVPLMIFEPGRTTRRDVYSTTSNVDLMPTLLHLAGQPIPGWVEGQVLPPYNTQEEDPQRSIFAAEAKFFIEQFGKISPGSFMIIKDGYKLTYYEGWDQIKETGPFTELYHLDNDPEEMVELSSTKKSLAGDLLNELLEKLEESNQITRDYQ